MERRCGLAWIADVDDAEWSAWQGPGKYRVSNTNYAKHNAQFHSVVRVTVAKSVETATR